MSKEIKNKRLFFNKYKIKKLIYNRHCQLYEGINIKDNEPVAMKFRKRMNDLDELESEAYYLTYLKGFGIPKIITFGRSGTYNILVEELLGPSLHILWGLKKSKNEKILLKDICMIALQGLDRLEYIHSKYIIHRDIKPHNFLLGKKDPEIIYLIDFGFSHKYRSSKTGKHIKFKCLKMACGSLQYLSLNGNRGYELSRRDDLESFLYMLIFLATNYLPWIKFQNSKLKEDELIKEIYYSKKYTPFEKICDGLPKEFIEYMKYIRNLKFEQDPDYYYLKGLFTSIITRNEQKNDLLFSWALSKTKIKKEESYNESKSFNLRKRSGSSQKRLYNKIKNSLEKKRSLQNIINNKKLERINLLTNKLANKEEKKYNNNVRIIKIDNIKKIDNVNNNNNLENYLYKKNNIFIKKNKIPLNINKKNMLLIKNNINISKNNNINLKIERKQSYQNFGKREIFLKNNMNNSYNSNNIINEYNTKRNLNIKNYKNIFEREKIKRIKEIQQSNLNILKLDKSIDIIKNKSPNFNIQNKNYKSIYRYNYNITNNYLMFIKGINETSPHEKNNLNKQIKLSKNIKLSNNLAKINNKIYIPFKRIKNNRHNSYNTTNYNSFFKEDNNLYK